MESFVEPSRRLEPRVVTEARGGRQRKSRRVAERSHGSRGADRSAPSAPRLDPACLPEAREDGPENDDGQHVAQRRERPMTEYREVENREAEDHDVRLA